MNTEKQEYTLGAYYQVFKNKKATDFVLSNFRKHFPKSPVFLISDGGDDFQEISTKYECGYIRLENIYGDEKNRFSINFYDSGRMKEAWRRHKMAVDYCNTDYMIILEDDVYVTREFKIKEHFALRGARIGNIFSSYTLEKVKLSGGIPSTNYGMCGGSLYNSEIFNSIYKDVILDIELEHDSLISSGKHNVLGAIDASITYHYNKRGYKYETSPWLVEIHEQKIHENFEVIHKYKQFYN